MLWTIITKNIIAEIGVDLGKFIFICIFSIIYICKLFFKFFHLFFLQKRCRKKRSRSQIPVSKSHLQKYVENVESQIYNRKNRKAQFMPLTYLFSVI